MRLKFCGANKEVTGSKHLLQVNNKNILVDCGFFQGRFLDDLKRNQTFIFSPSKIDCLLLTHAHIDHSGNIPTLVKQGFKGKIFATQATIDITQALLFDSAKVQAQDAEHWAKDYGVRVNPLYNDEDVKRIIPHFERVEYNESFILAPGVKATYYDAGHVLGSAVIKLEIQEGQTQKTVCFSGDLGRHGMPIMRDPYQLKYGDIFVCESTYGSHLHDSFSNTVEDLRLIINDVFNRQGKILIPAFALERTQELIYVLHQLYDRDLVPKMPIFVDSPLAINIGEEFIKHPEYYDQETFQDFLLQGKNPFSFKELNYIREVEESKRLNHYQGPCIIIAASGMCEAGRIVHHLKYHIEDPRNLVLVIGFMAQGTVGRDLVENKRKIRIFDRYYDLRCDVEVLNTFSSHADKLDLLNYIKNISNLSQIFLVHGEETESFVLRDGIYNILKFQGKVHIPDFGQEVEV